MGPSEVERRSRSDDERRDPSGGRLTTPSQPGPAIGAGISRINTGEPWECGAAGPLHWTNAAEHCRAAPVAHMRRPEHLVSSTDRLHALDGRSRLRADRSASSSTAPPVTSRTFPRCCGRCASRRARRSACCSSSRHMFRMSLFFLIAGFFGRMLIERKGTRGLHPRPRPTRILLPLVVGLPVILLLFGGCSAGSVFSWAG